jgi:hypothetical protein
MNSQRSFDHLVGELLKLQSHVMTERCDVMGARAGLHADQTARNIGKTTFELTTGYLCCRTTAPRLSNPTKWNVFLPRSTQIVVMVSGVL